MKIALFQPDIPQNTGTIIRTAACLDVGVDLIEPLGFVLTDKHLKRAGMDYLDMAHVERHSSWQAFMAKHEIGNTKLVLLTTSGDTPYTNFKFSPSDTILLGSEGSGVPDYVHENTDARLVIPMAGKTRSLNVAIACSMVLGEALRQTSKS
ncbi:MAG: tRNA (cytidine(34)-2'-O)-methyltransferase [Rhodospirillaceae bacterium]|nr:tRNA (cytidine(34)-2'-O)-methyltransferase [Rhodospirillaceae bacterium]